jgi:S1-C subfamily serine protease
MKTASNYICATPLGDLAMARGPSGIAVEQSATLLAEIERRCGPDVALTFAQPALPRSAEAVVSWYAAAEGSPRRLIDFDDIGRRPFAQVLRTRLAQLYPLLADPAIGADIGAALNIRSFGDIYVVGNDPILVNWGLLPKAAASTESAREAHFRETLGQFLPEAPTPPFEPREARGFAEALALRERASTARRKISTARKSPDIPSLPESSRVNDLNGSALSKGAVAASRTDSSIRRRPWLPPLIACLLAGAVLVFLQSPGTLTRFSPDPSPTQSEIDRQRDLLRAINGSIQAQIDGLKQESATLVCRLRPDQPATGEAVATVPPNLLPLSPEANVAQTADQAVALVRARHKNSPVTGSAFFISDQLLITNAHVVADDEDGDALQVTIENKTLGSRIPVRVIARSRKRGNDDVDLALLQAPPNTSKVSLAVASDALRKMTPVQAIGFAGMLIEETTAAIPESNVSLGIVSTFLEGGAVDIAHTASIWGGNSGGPLLDMCGSVVGVNTAFKADRAIPAGSPLAQSRKVLEEFLSANGRSVAHAASACDPKGLAFAKQAAAGSPAPPH